MNPNNFFVIAGRFCFIFLFLFCVNCGKDDTAPPYVPPPPPPPPPPLSCANCQLLFYGANQLDAPTLSGGSYEAAARYTPAKIGNLVGKTIKEIHFFIAERPDSIKIKVYGPMNATTPGSLLYSADMTSSALANKWNVHTLTQALMLNNEDIWLSIQFKIAGSRRTIGCDPGPAITDGDWLHSSDDGLWTPYNKRTTTSINWTIRLNVAL